MTRWADPPGAARKHGEPLLGAVRTLDAGEPAAGIAAVKILLDHFLDDRPEKTILPLETTLILNADLGLGRGGGLSAGSSRPEFFLILPQPGHGRVDGLLKPVF